MVDLEKRSMKQVFWGWKHKVVHDFIHKMLQILELAYGSDFSFGTLGEKLFLYKTTKLSFLSNFLTSNSLFAVCNVQP